jgi:putative endonuclease
VAAAEPAPDAWWLYVLLCANERLYIGIARDVDQRFAVHCAGRGAIYTRLNAPVRVLARQAQPSRSAALKAEYALKQLTRERKLSWVAAQSEPAGKLVAPPRDGRS